MTAEPMELSINVYVDELWPAYSFDDDKSTDTNTTISVSKKNWEEYKAARRKIERLEEVFLKALVDQKPDSYEAGVM